MKVDKLFNSHLFLCSGVLIQAVFLSDLRCSHSLLKRFLQCGFRMDIKAWTFLTMSPQSGVSFFCSNQSLVGVFSLFFYMCVCVCVCVCVCGCGCACVLLPKWACLHAVCMPSCFTYCHNSVSHSQLPAECISHKNILPQMFEKPCRSSFWSHHIENSHMLDHCLDWEHNHTKKKLYKIIIRAFSVTVSDLTTTKSLYVKCTITT